MGAIFPFFIYVIRTLPLRPLVPRIPLLQNMKSKIYRINFFFSLCILISIALQNAPTSRPVLEADFLSYFVLVEMFINTSFYWGMIVNQQINSDPSMGTFFAYMAMIGSHWFLMSEHPIPHEKFYRTLTHACHTQAAAAVGLTPSYNSDMTTAQGLDVRFRG